jgi:hypothetical protein
MAKFYVSTGNLQLVIEADHARAAAIWAVHRCLSQVMPFASAAAEADETLSYESAAPHRYLGETIIVSERGFAGDDQQVFATLPVVAEWSKLLVALDRLQQDLGSP